MTQSFEIVTVTEFDESVYVAVSRLLLQLGSSIVVSRDLLRRTVENETTTLFVARREEEINGMIVLVVFPLPSGMRAYLDDLVVDASARQQGVGGALVAAALASAQAQGLRTVDLTTRPVREAAIHLYTELGFVLRDSRVYRYQTG